MKQVELAQRLGISKSYLSMILSGKRKAPAHLEKPFCELIHNKTASGSASQAGSREFESRLPLHFQKDVSSNPALSLEQLLLSGLDEKSRRDRSAI